MKKKYQLNLLLSFLAILSLLGILTSFSHYQSVKNTHPSKARIEQYKITAEIIATNYSSTGIEELPDMDNTKVTTNKQQLLESLDNEDLTYIIAFSPNDRYYKIDIIYKAERVDNRIIIDTEEPSVNIYEWTIPFKNFISSVVLFSLLFVALCLVLFYSNRKPKEEREE